MTNTLRLTVAAAEVRPGDQIFDSPDGGELTAPVVHTALLGESAEGPVAWCFNDGTWDDTEEGLGRVLIERRLRQPDALGR